MIPYPKALEIIAAKTVPLAPVRVKLVDALGKVAAKTIVSDMAVPSFRNSMMDGFALLATDLNLKATTLPLLPNAIAAGNASAMHQAGSCVEITTGAMLPDGCDTVVPVEDVKVHADCVKFPAGVKAGQFVRPVGSDFAAGAVLLQAGERVHAGHIMALAAAGIAEVKARVLPEIFLFTTGNEVVESGTQPLPAGKIYNANAPFLLARLAEEGIAAHHGGALADDVAAFHAALDKVPAGSIVITTGAISKGQWDFIPEALLARGAKIHFHRVAVRPAKPILFATLPCGTLLLGLPGNPVSAAIGLRFFLLPLLRRMQQQPAEPPIMARLTTPYTKDNDFRHFLKAELSQGADGVLEVRLMDGQESYKTLPLTISNAWVMADEAMRHWQAGTMVPVYGASSASFPFIQQESVKQWQAA